MLNSPIKHPTISLLFCLLLKSRPTARHRVPLTFRSLAGSFTERQPFHRPQGFLLFVRLKLKMSSDGLLTIEPQDLQFSFELKKQISSSLQLSNKSDNYVAFKVKTTNPKKYCVRPNTGVVPPRSAFTMQAQKEAPVDMFQCKDKFLLQSVVTSPGATAKDVSAEMFNKEAGHHVEERKLRVVYVAPPRPPSPVREGSEEGDEPRTSLSDNGGVNAVEHTSVSLSVHYQNPEGLEFQASALISKLTDEKDSAIKQNKQLQRELVKLWLSAILFF
ncbi:Vesicle-associated protein 1-2 [Linum perenne]